MARAAAQRYPDAAQPHPAGHLLAERRPSLEAGRCPACSTVRLKPMCFLPPVRPDLPLVCIYCFRWAQFVDGRPEDWDHRRRRDGLVGYLREHPR